MHIENAYSDLSITKGTLSSAAEDRGQGIRVISGFPHKVAYSGQGIKMFSIFVYDLVCKKADNIRSSL